MTGIGFWCVTLHGERSEPCNVGQQKLFTSIWLHYFALGNKSGGFCEAVNCEQSEQEGKFLFAYLLVPTTFDMFNKRISGLWLYFVVSIGITACSIVMDVALVIKTAERHLIYFIATQLMSLASYCFHFVVHLFFIY